MTVDPLRYATIQMLARPGLGFGRDWGMVKGAEDSFLDKTVKWLNPYPQMKELWDNVNNESRLSQAKRIGALGLGYAVQNLNRNGKALKWGSGGLINTIADKFTDSILRWTDKPWFTRASGMKRPIPFDRARGLGHYATRVSRVGKLFGLPDNIALPGKTTADTGTRFTLLNPRQYLRRHSRRSIRRRRPSPRRRPTRALAATGLRKRKETKRSASF